MPLKRKNILICQVVCMCAIKRGIICTRPATSWHVTKFGSLNVTNKKIPLWNHFWLWSSLLYHMGKAPLAQLITSSMAISNKCISAWSHTSVSLSPTCFQSCGFKWCLLLRICWIFFGKTSFISTLSVLIFFARRNLSAFWVTDSHSS